MPVYEYACEKCKHEFEAEQRISDDPIRVCPKCRARKVKRLISRTSFVLKGSGWYSDLYSSPGAKKKGDAERAGGESGDKGPRATRSPTPSRRRSPRRNRRRSRQRRRTARARQGEEQVESGLSEPELRRSAANLRAHGNDRRRRTRARAGDPQRALGGRRAPRRGGTPRAPCSRWCAWATIPRARRTSRASGARARASASTRPRPTCPRRRARPRRSRRSPR